MFNTEVYTQQVIDLVGQFLESHGYTKGNPTDNVGEVFENEVFLIRSYDWLNDDESEIPNFWYKPANFQVRWYKYVGRGTFSNYEIDIEDALNLFYNCLDSLNPDDAVHKNQSDWWWKEVDDGEED